MEKINNIIQLPIKDLLLSKTTYKIKRLVEIKEFSKYHKLKTKKIKVTKFYFNLKNNSYYQKKLFLEIPRSVVILKKPLLLKYKNDIFSFRIPLFREIIIPNSQNIKINNKLFTLEIKLFDILRRILNKENYYILVYKNGKETKQKIIENNYEFERDIYGILSREIK